MVKYPGQFKDDYTIAKVTEVHPSEDGLVRQVTVSFKKKNTRESPEVYKSKPLASEKVAVHRLHKLQLVDEDLQLSSVQQGQCDVNVDCVQGDDQEEGVEVVDVQG